MNDSAVVKSLTTPYTSWREQRERGARPLDTSEKLPSGEGELCILCVRCRKRHCRICWAPSRWNDYASFLREDAWMVLDNAPSLSDRRGHKHSLCVSETSFSVLDLQDKRQEQQYQSPVNSNA